MKAKIETVRVEGEVADAIDLLWSIAESLAGKLPNNKELKEVNKLLAKIVGGLKVC